MWVLHEDITPLYKPSFGGKGDVNDATSLVGDFFCLFSTGTALGVIVLPVEMYILA